MFRRVNSSPMLFSQPLETKNRQMFRRFKSIAEKVSNLLSDRSVLALRSSLKFPVERVGKVLDVQNCHGITPKLLHNGGTVGDVSRPLLSPRMSIGSSSLSFSWKVTNAWQNGFLREIPEKGKVRIAAYLLCDFDGGPGWT